MLSYRHAFHAGNHADVLKHLVWVQLISRLTKKDKPLWIIDTHAGAGCYALDSGYALKNAEFQTGIARLWSMSALPEPLDDYVAAVRAFNSDGVLRGYPGSPQLAAQLMRDNDRLRLFELHSNESKALKAHFQHGGRRIGVSADDGYAGLKAVLPPPSRRGLVLIDPSYEQASDYAAVRAAVRDALERFPTGTYAVWYPQLSRREARSLPVELRRKATCDWLDVSLQVSAPHESGFGLHGSGMFVLNPPWKLETALAAAMPTLVDALGQDDGASYSLEFRQT